MGRAGTLDRRIRLDRPVGGQDATGGPVSGGFSPVATVWAGRKDKSASESMKAEQRSSEVVTVFRVRSSSITRKMTPEYQIFHENRNYEITGIVETSEGRNNYLEIMTVVIADGDEVENG